MAPVSEPLSPGAQGAAGVTKSQVRPDLLAWGVNQLWGLEQAVENWLVSARGGVFVCVCVCVRVDILNQTSPMQCGGRRGVCGRGGGERKAGAKGRRAGGSEGCSSGRAAMGGCTLGPARGSRLIKRHTLRNNNNVYRV